MKTHVTSTDELIAGLRNGMKVGTVCMVENLSKTFGDRVVLDGVGLHIGDGERVELMGPSGPGRSAMLSCVQVLTGRMVAPLILR